MNVLSLGAGVQSTTVLLMSLEGELPPLDAAIFADTQWEPAAVYGHLWWLAQQCANKNVPLYVVTAGNIREDALDHSHRFASMPVYIRTAGKEREGMVRRQCTREYKIEPIRRQVRTLLGLKPRQRIPAGTQVTQWFGISLDEVRRMRDPEQPWMTHYYPLVDARMTRADCHRWLADREIVAPRSACIGCPFHNDHEWRHLRDNTPAEWADAVSFDAEIRSGHQGGRVALEGSAYLHRSLQPLDQVDLATEKEKGQGDLFDQECEGMCGV